MNKAEIIVFIKNEIAEALEKKSQSIDEDMNFMKIGISSIKTLKIINKMSRALEIDINPVAMFEYTTIEEFAGYLSECVNGEAVL